MSLARSFFATEIEKKHEATKSEVITFFFRICESEKRFKSKSK